MWGLASEERRVGVGGFDGFGDPSTTFAISAYNIDDGFRDFVRTAGGFRGTVFVVSRGSATEAASGSGISGCPFETAGIKDVDSRRIAGNVSSGIATDNDYLAANHVARVAGPCHGNGLFGLVDFDPGEGGDGEDPHIVFLFLLAIGN